MSIGSRIFISIFFLVHFESFGLHMQSEADKVQFDVAVYGATPGGVSAAINAAREGVSVVLLQNDGHIGGLASGGLSNPDFRSFESLGGTYREMMMRIEQYYKDKYGVNSSQVINCVKGAYGEPKVVRLVFEEMLNEAGVRVYLNHQLEAVRIKKVDGSTRPVSARFTSLKDGGDLNVSAAVFIDGTYEGDFMAASKVPYRVGREAMNEYDESLAPESADNLVQAYNFRIVLTTDKNNQISISKPKNYNRSAYASLVSYINKNNIRTTDDISRYLLRIRRMPNKKAEFNDVRTAPLSLSRTEINNEWPEGDAEIRAKIFDEYKNWSLGLLFFLQNDKEVPEEVRSAMSEWALPADEYVDNNNWTPALYVREGRRMVGEYVFTEHDTGLESNSVRSSLQNRAIAITDYSINTHGVSRPSEGEHLGVIGRSVRPMQIPYDILLPKEMDALLVPVAVSSSHVGFAALRYEPLWTALGQAAGIAAAQALKNEIELREVNVKNLQLRLHELGTLTIYVSDLGVLTNVLRPDWERPSDSFQIWLNQTPAINPLFKPIQFFGTYGFFHHLIDPTDANEWTRSRSTGQWSLRMPYHALEPTRLVDQELANTWLKMAEDLGIKPSISIEQILEEQMTRGDMLTVLFESISDN